MADNHFNYCLELQWTPLHMAAGEGHKNSVESLLNKGAEVNITNHDGVSACK